MSGTPTKTQAAAANGAEYKTPKKQKEPARHPKSASLKSIENLTNSEESSAAEVEDQPRITRRSLRKPSPTKKYTAYKEGVATNRIVANYVECSNSDEEESENAGEDEEPVVAAAKPHARDLELIQSEYNVAGASMFGFNTPKKRDAMSLAAQNATPATPKTPKTPRLGVKTPDTKRRKADEPKTPSHVRTRVKKRKLCMYYGSSLIS